MISHALVTNALTFNNLDARMAPTVSRQDRRENRRSATSASARIQVTSTTRNARGRVVRTRQTLTQAEILLIKEAQEAENSNRRAGERIVGLPHSILINI